MRHVIALLASLLLHPVTSPAPVPASVPAGTFQLLVVTARGSSGTLTAYASISGQWRVVFPGMPARIGARGLSDHKREGDLTTPSGTFAIGPTMYGLRPNPGVHYPYHALVPGDYWNENPSSPGYNTFVHGPNPGGASEALWRIAPQYDYFAIIQYNTPAVPGRGSGVFLHEMVPGHATAGCVALARDNLVKILRWLDPGAAPRIVLRQ